MSAQTPDMWRQDHDDYTVIYQHGRFICRVENTGNLTERELRDVCATLVAAREMREALTKCRTAMAEQETAVFVPRGFEAEISAADAAIARAEGRAS